MNDPLNRRNFLKTSGRLAALGALSTLAPAIQTQADKAARRKRDLKKAVNLGMVAGKGSVLDKFKLLKQIGFDGVELNRPGGPPAAEILKARDATGLLVANVIDSVHWHDTLSDPNPEVRARGLTGLKGALRDAKTFDCKTVLLVPAVVSKQVSYADAYTRSQAEIRKAVPLAEELGVSIDIEDVWNHFLLSPLEAARYVDEFNSPAVGWHFDVGNIIAFGWPEQWIHILGHRIHNIHVKEYSRTKQNNEGMWAGFKVKLLEGDDDWPTVMKAFDDIGYHGWAVAEVPGGDADRLRFIADRMDKIFAL